MGAATTAVAAAGITIILVAATPAIITTLTTGHRIPMIRTRMTAEDVAGEAIQGAVAMEAAGVVEGIDRTNRPA